MAVHLKKIDTRDLRIGMYVEALDRPWLETPYLLEGVDIKTDADIDELRALCSHVYIRSDEPWDDQPHEGHTRTGNDVIPPLGDRTPRGTLHESLAARAARGHA